MIADIVIVLIAVAFMAWGAYRGFMRGILGFITNTVAIILALLGARPILSLINSITNNTIVRDGQLGILIMVAIALFIAIRLIVMILKFKIMKIKDRFRMVNAVDRVLGALLGLFKFALAMAIVAILVLLLGNIFSGLRPWLFEGSIIAEWIYDRALDVVLPFLSAVSAAVFGAIRG